MQKAKVFDFDFVVNLTKNINSARSILQSYKKNGYIVSIRRNLYAAVDLSSGCISATKFEIGSAINKTSYISHHAALEYYGYANQVFLKQIVSSEQKFNNFTYDGITYEHHDSKTTSGIIRPWNTPHVVVTDLERTVVDCLDDIESAGGYEELFRAMEMIPSLDEKKLLDDLNAYNKIFLWQKAGFILKHYASQLNLSAHFFGVCRNNVHNKVRYLTSKSKKVYIPEWKLYVPLNFFGDEEEDYFV